MFCTQELSFSYFFIHLYKNIVFPTQAEYSYFSEEYKGRNRHNVECFFERVLYFGWPNQPSSGTMENFASGRVFYVAYYRKYVKIIDSVNYR